MSKIPNDTTNADGLRVRMTDGKARDTGMAMVLITLIVHLTTRDRTTVLIAVVLLVLTMTVPAIYRPVGYVWFGLSTVLGTIVSRIVIGATFFLLVTPVGMIRRLAGADPLRMKCWKQDRSTVFKTRDHQYTKNDLSHPY